jgi:hypothetical protein
MADGEIEKALRVAGEMARRADVAIQRRDRAIRAAYEAGATLRAIGRAVGTSHNPIRRIIDETEPRA